MKASSRHVLLGPADLNAGTLTTLDVLIVPNGNVDTIATGQGPGTVWDRYPWEPDEDRQALPKGSFDSIRSWVHDGGTYVGVDAGGGLLATQDHLGLVDAKGRAGNLGTGLVELRNPIPSTPFSMALPVPGTMTGRGVRTSYTLCISQTLGQASSGGASLNPDRQLAYWRPSSELSRSRTLNI